MILDKQFAISHIKKTLRDLELFCRKNDIDGHYSFGAGVEWKSHCEIDEKGDWKFSDDEGYTRSFSTIEFSLTVHDSNKDGQITNLAGTISNLLENMKPPPHE